MSHLNSPPTKSPALHGAEISARADSQQREANELFSLYGRSADSPRVGETDEGYTRRLLESAKRYSEICSGIDFLNASTMRADALPQFWRLAVSKGIETFKRPEGPLRKAVHKDQTGREIIEWFGDEAEAWAPFHNGPMPGRFDFSKCTGANAPGAARVAKHIMSDGTVVDARHD